MMKVVEPYLGKARKPASTDNVFYRNPLCHEVQKEDVTCGKPEQNLKRSSATGYFSKKRQKPSHNLDSLPMETHKERLSSQHTLHIFYGQQNDNKKKQETVTFYNKTKCGVDVADQMPR